MSPFSQKSGAPESPISVLPVTGSNAKANGDEARIFSEAQRFSCHQLKTSPCTPKS